MVTIPLTTAGVWAVIQKDAPQLQRLIAQLLNEAGPPPADD
jgi:hypothetical protein